jgi:hypothetical protein
LKIFSPAHFLRHVSMPTLQEFTDAHPIGSRLSIDWNSDPDTLPAKVNAAIDELQASLNAEGLSREEAAAIGDDLHLWHDDLRRVHLLANELASNEFHVACAEDPEALQAFSSRDAREKALWVFHARDQLFRDVELHLAFQAKANGKYWKKHRIEAGLNLTNDREKLEAFGHQVAKLFEKSGGGKSTHIEQSFHASDGSVQLTIYVEGPITALAHFAENKFNRVTTRIALETAVVYQPATGVIESVVKGGSKNHQTVLQLFGKHVVGREIQPEEIEKTRFKLNELRDGLETFEDLSHLGVEKIRLRRAQFRPRGSTGIAIRIEASAEQDQDDAIELARNTLQIRHSFETEYNLDGASVLVYLAPMNGQKPKRFSFDVYSTGSSTIKNLSEKNQPIANAVLQSLNVIESEETTV